MKNLLITCLLCMIAFPACGWNPPEKPDPKTILGEARRDAADVRFRDALAKHVWFHEHALDIEPSQAGVRVSFALASWVDLGKVYPKALEKLRSIRDATGLAVLANPEPQLLFTEYKSICKYLGEDNLTVTLFSRLEARDPALAKKVYSSAQSVLLRTGHPELCAKYLAPEESWPAILKDYQHTTALARDPKLGQKIADYARQSFTNKTTILVALLTTNGRKPEAENIVKSALEVLGDDAFKKQLESSLAGTLPTPWP